MGTGQSNGAAWLCGSKVPSMLKANQAAETRPWEGRVVATEGGPEGRALREQASTKAAQKAPESSDWRHAIDCHRQPLGETSGTKTKPLGSGAEDPAYAGPGGRHRCGKCRAQEQESERQEGLHG
jgi:hypothetical protein